MADASRPHPASRTCALPQGELHYLDVGEGVPVLALHKLTGGAEPLLECLEPLPLSRRWLCPDLRGHGWSLAPAQGYALDDYAADLVALVEHLALSEPVVLLGHSLGARLALHLAARGRLDVRGVVAIDPPLSGPGRRPYPYALDDFLGWKDAIEREGLQACLSSSTAYSRRQAELRYEYGLRVTRAAIVESWQGFHHDDLFAELPSLRVPVIALLGSKGVTSEDERRELATFPGVEVVTLDGIGHNVPWEAPHAITAALQRIP